MDDMIDIGGSAFERSAEFIKVGVVCPKCGTPIYALLDSTPTHDASTEPGLCPRCFYRGFEHGGFTEKYTNLVDEFRNSVESGEWNGHI